MLEKKIARRTTLELSDGEVVNLGFGFLLRFQTI